MSTKHVSYGATPEEYEQQRFCPDATPDPELSVQQFRSKDTLASVCAFVAMLDTVVHQ